LAARKTKKLAGYRKDIKQEIAKQTIEFVVNSFLSLEERNHHQFYLVMCGN
jgi:CRISPR/Cas system type I-B associated protein Csh2 (Cas7 group RAMP superfamily)